MLVKEATLHPETGIFPLKAMEEKEELVEEEETIAEVEEAVEVEGMGTMLTPTCKTPIILHGGEHLKNGSSIINWMLTSYLNGMVQGRPPLTTQVEWAS